MRQYYRILGVSPTATQAQIKDAWLFSLKAFHPDKFFGSSKQQQAIAHERTKAINEAHDVLSNPTTRAAYDRELHQTGVGATKAPPPQSSPPPSPPPPRPRPRQQPSTPDPAEGGKNPSTRQFIKSHFTLGSRIGRATFVVRLASATIAFSLVGLLAAVQDKDNQLGLVILLVGLLFVYFAAIQIGQRLHDVNASAGWAWFGLSGIGALILAIILLLRPGTSGPNRYGEKPATARGMSIAAWLIALSLGLGLGVSIVATIVSDWSRSTTSQNESIRVSSKTASSPPATDAIDQFLKETNSIGLVNGTDIKFSLSIPDGWALKRKGQLTKEESAFDLIASHNAQYVAVIAEEANLGSPENVLKFVHETIEKNGTNVRVGEASPIVLDGRTFLAFNAWASVDKIPFGFQYYVYTGQEGTFQLIGWTVQNLFNRDADTLRNVMASFKFPQSESETALSTTRAEPEGGSASPMPANEERTFDLPALAKAARPAVLLIVGFDAHGKIIQTGSGFFVSSSGRVVTNWHVIDGVTTAAAKTENGAVYDINGVLAFSATLDLAVLKADARDVPFLEVEKTNYPEVGTRIAVIGSPLALEGTLSEGIVSAERPEENGAWIQISAPISPGSSGSPVLDKSGSVVGVATLNSSGRYQNLNFARSSHDLVPLLEGISDDTKLKSFAELASASRNEAIRTFRTTNDNFLAANKTQEGVTTTASGLQYKVLKEGAGPAPNATDTVTVNYRGTTIEGTEFDSSYKRGEPATFPVNQVIKGWTEGLQLMKVRSKYRFFIPSTLAYGERGAGTDILPHQTLIFDVELLSVKPQPGLADTLADSPTYHVVGIGLGDFLNIRAGPGSNYAIVSKLRGGRGGIIPGSEPAVSNGATVWQKIFIDGNSGWANSEYLLFDSTQSPPVKAVPPVAVRASQTRNLTLTNVRTGETCKGGFNLARMQGWVILPDGSRLSGNLSGDSDATQASPGTRGEGSALLVSADGRQKMTVNVVSDGLVMHGSGEGVMNDGRHFRIRW